MKKDRKMKVYSTDRQDLMEVSSVGRKENALLIKGKIFGTMPMTAVVNPEEARNFIKLLDFKTILFLLTLLFRRSSKQKVT